MSRALQRHRLDQAERLFAFGIRPELVVSNPIGEPWQPATFSGAWKDWAKAHGVAGITFHGLRRSRHALAAAGVPDAVAASVMGIKDKLFGRTRAEIPPDVLLAGAQIRPEPLEVPSGFGLYIVRCIVPRSRPSI